MPTAPQYGERQVKTRPLDAPLVNPGIASADAFGAPIAEGANRLAVTVAGVQQRERQRVSDTRAMDARTKALEKVQAIESQARLRKGDKVRDLGEWYNAEYRKAIAEAGSGLSDDAEATDTFGRMMEARRVDGMGVIQRHQDEELDKFERATWIGGNEAARSDALNGVIPLDRALNMQRGNVDQLADRDGLPPEQRDLLWQGELDKTVAGAVGVAIDADDFARAGKLLDDYGEQMSKPLRESLGGKVRDLSRNQQAQDTADGLFDQSPASKAEIDGWVSQLTDADLRQKTQAKVDQEWNRLEAIKDAKATEVVDRMTKAIDQGADAEKLILKDKESAMLTPQHKSMIRSYANQVASGREPAHGGPHWLELGNEAVMDPAKFVKRNLWQVRDKLPTSEWKQLVDQQQRIKEGTLKKDDTDPIPPGIFSSQEIGNRALRGAGIDHTIKDGVPKDPRSEAFLRIYSQAVQARGGTKKLTEKDQEKIAADLLIKHRIASKGSFGREVFKEVARFELPGMADAAFVPRDVPAKYRTEIADEMRKRGLTEEDLGGESGYMEAYQKLMERDALLEQQKQDAANVRAIGDIDPFQGGGL